MGYVFNSDFFQNLTQQKQIVIDTIWEELRQDISYNWNKIPDDGKLALKNKLNSTWSRLRYRASPQSIRSLKEFQKNTGIEIRGNYVLNVNGP